MKSCYRMKALLILRRHVPWQREHLTGAGTEHGETQRLAGFKWTATYAQLWFSAGSTDGAAVSASAAATDRTCLAASPGSEHTSSYYKDCKTETRQDPVHKAAYL